jgi:hypothetical protein
VGDHRVVALGIVNAGKSSVLSALADRKNLFPCDNLLGTTREVQREGAGLLLLVDTPGLDADGRNAEQAFAETARADTVLWCHSLREGELLATELEALSLYAVNSRSIWRTCFVLTHGDDIPNRDYLRVVSARIAKQLQEVFRLRFRGVDEPAPLLAPGERGPRPFNVVGVRSYWRALEKGSRASRRFLESTGIPRLRAFLEKLATSVSYEGSHG